MNRLRKRTASRSCRGAEIVGPGPPGPGGRWPMGCAAASTPATGSPSSSTATSTTPISASPAAASALFTGHPGPGGLCPGLGRTGRQTPGTQGPRRQRRSAAGRAPPRLAPGLLPNWSTSSGASASRSTASPRRRSFIWPQTTPSSLEELIRRLRDGGLDSIPGGGAEILVDRVRQQISPQKCSSCPVAGGHGGGPPPGPQHHRHHDVRARGDPGRASRTPVQDSRPPGRNRRLHRLHPLDLPARGHPPDGPGPGRGGVL